MAKKLSSTKKVPGIALIVTGVGLAIWGYQMSRGFSSELSNALTGSYSDTVMMLYIGGAVCFTIGLYLSIKN